MGLVYLPCRDSIGAGSFVRSVLDIDRRRAAALGQSAVDAMSAGSFRDEDGNRVDWSAHVMTALAAKGSIAADAALRTSTNRFEVCNVSVRNETSLMAAQRLAASGSPLVLNFANGVVPGGGFLSGARGQEEVLCRSTALFATLEGDPMYDVHRRRRDRESTAHAILSPDVPVFRTDDGRALAQPWLAAFVTCAAPVAHHVGQPRSGDLLRRRIGRVLDIAAAYGYDTLVLGAWGCGAFGNDPRQTARDFHEALQDRSERFRDVIFAISDWSPERRFLGPFRDEFAGDRPRYVP